MAFKTSQMDQIALSRVSQGRWKRISSTNANLEKPFTRTEMKLPHMRRSVSQSLQLHRKTNNAQNTLPKLGGCVLEPRTQLLLSLLLLLLLSMTILIIGFTCPPTIHFKFIQSATAYVITKGDGLLLQSATAFFITKCNKCYYKGREVLQSATERAF